MKKLNIDNYIGCIVGGAIGDALGAPTEFMNLESILHNSAGLVRVVLQKKMPICEGRHLY